MKKFLFCVSSIALIIIAATYGNSIYQAAAAKNTFTASALQGYSHDFDDALIQNARYGMATFAPLPSITHKPALKGVHISWDADDITDFEKKLDTTVDLVATEVHWGNNNQFPDFLSDAVADKGKTLVLFWNPMDYRGSISEQSDFSYDKILDGKWDDYITSFARSAAAYKGKVIIAPFEEVNGYWTPWSGTGIFGSHDDYIKTYRYLRTFFKSDNVSFAWVVNHISLPETESNSISAYYPGSAYVDIIGINGFNFGDPWLSFDEIFSAAVKEVSKYKKPIYVFSTGTGENDADSDKKPKWITGFLNSRLLKSGAISGWIWFNELKERDWRAWSSDKSLEAFKENL